MNSKLDKLRDELAKARKKKAEWDTKVKELERKCREEENSQIHDMVHAANVTPEQLKELLEMFASDTAQNSSNIIKREVDIQDEH